MYMFHVFGVGFYNIILWPLHIPLWCTGYLAQDKLKSPKGRLIFLSILAAGFFLCEMLCHWVFTGFDSWVPAIGIICLWDLVFGYFAKPVFRILRRLFRILIDWICSDEEAKPII